MQTGSPSGSASDSLLNTELKRSRDWGDAGLSGTSGIVGTSSKSGATKDAAGTGGAWSANDNLPSRAVFRVPCG